LYKLIDIDEFMGFEKHFVLNVLRKQREREREREREIREVRD